MYGPKLVISKLFKDGTIQKEFERNGIVKAATLKEDTVEQLYNIFTKYHSELDDYYFHRFHVGVHSNDLEYKKKVHEEIAVILDPIYESIFASYRRLTFTMQIKGTGPESILPLHQDWSLVDEHKFSSATVWLTLCDSTIDNGAIHAVAGSHLFLNSPRAGTIQSRIDHLHLDVLPLMVPYPCKAGTILVFDPRIFHYSPANSTKAPRISVINSIVPQNAQVVQYFKDIAMQRDIVELYAVPDDFHFYFNDFVEKQHEIKPNGEKTRTIEYDTTLISFKQFNSWYRLNLFKKKYMSFFSDF